MSHHDNVAADVNPEGWRLPAVLVYGNADTLARKEAALVLSYAPGAEPRKGAYVIEAESPSGARTRDTLSMAITPDASGNNLREMRLPYRTGVRLAEEGDYVFTVTPPTGTSGIWSVAIDFKKVKSNGER